MGFRVCGRGHVRVCVRVWGLGFRVQGFGFRVYPEGRDGRVRVGLGGEHAVHRQHLRRPHLAGVFDAAVVAALEVQLRVPVQRLDVLLFRRESASGQRAGLKV